MTCSRPFRFPASAAAPTAARRRSLTLCSTLALSLLLVQPGCEKSGSSSAPEATASAAPSATPRTATTATPTPAAKTPSATPAATAQPTRAPAATTKPAAAAVPQAMPKPATSADAIDQDEIVRLCAAAKLPAPPDMADFPPDVASWLATLIRDAAKNPSAETIGRLGCLYHDIMTNREESERAQQCYEMAKELDPKSYVWPHLLGRLFLRRQSEVRARREFKTSIACDPNYPDNYAWLADLDLKAGAAKDARDYFEKAIEKLPDEPYSYAGLAEAELALGNLEAAKAALDKATAINASNRRVQAALDSYYEKTGDTARAARHRAMAAQLPSAVISHTDPINEMLIVASGPTTLATNRVRVLADGGDLDRAFAMRDLLLATYPNNAVLLTGTGELDLLLRRPQDAIERFRQAIAADPEYTRAFVGLSDSLAATGRAEEALAEAERAIAIDPSLNGGYVAKGRALQYLGRTDESIATFKKALEIQPDNLILRTTIGDLLVSQGKLDEARAWCTQIVRAAEAAGDDHPAVATAYVTLGMIAEQQGDAQTAVKSYSLALKRNPTLEPVFRQLARLLIQLGRGDDALRIGAQLRDANPQMLEYALSYGNLLALLGKTQEAIDYFQKLIEKMPDHPMPRYALAVIYRDQHEAEKSRQLLEEVVKLEPTYEAAWVLLFDNKRKSSGPAEALQTLQSGLTHLPDSVLLNNSLAWVLATSPDASLRDPQRAVDLAENVVERSHRGTANYLDTLGCAYAAAGRFDDAIRAEKEAVTIAEGADQQDLTQEFKDRIALFESGKAYVEQE
ncbi:MAG TPA: tetratricopeptide repeat protein [Phycisphaerae bacterium]|nr:tetratricopeptide repeat protein [Phycisphaerae bacterium]